MIRVRVERRQAPRRYSARCSADLHDARWYGPYRRWRWVAVRDLTRHTVFHHGLIIVERDR